MGSDAGPRPTAAGVLPPWRAIMGSDAGPRPTAAGKEESRDPRQQGCYPRGGRLWVAMLVRDPRQQEKKRVATHGSRGATPVEGDYG